MLCKGFFKVLNIQFYGTKKNFKFKYHKNELKSNMTEKINF